MKPEEAALFKADAILAALGVEDREDLDELVGFFYAYGVCFASLDALLCLVLNHTLISACLVMALFAERTRRPSIPLLTPTMSSHGYGKRLSCSVLGCIVPLPVCAMLLPPSPSVKPFWRMEWERMRVSCLI